MATLATLLESDSDEFSSGEEAEDTPRNSLETPASAVAKDAKDITDDQKSHKQESGEAIAARKK